jgi:membrane-associated phospholipid phosphatase
MQQLLNNAKFNWKIQPLLGSLAAIFFCLLLWFNHYSHPWCEYIDKQFFLAMNKTLLWSTYWQQLCGWLNHPAESWLNLVLMVAINFVAITFLPKNKRKHACIFVVYCWLLFQVGLFFSHAIFGNSWLAIERASPSLVINPIIKLSNLVSFPVKDYSENSFPAGHTFVLIYWAGFTCKYATQKFKFLTYIVAIMLIFPRLISGAHWLSDVIFTIAISYTWLALVIGTPLYSYIETKLSQKKYLEK